MRFPVAPSLVFLILTFLHPAVSEAQNDSWIRGEVRARFLLAGLRPLRKQIQVYDGVVYLSGKAKSEEAIYAASEIVAEIPGGWPNENFRQFN